MSTSLVKPNPDGQSSLDYDTIAGEYDRRFQSPGFQGVEELLRRVRAYAYGRALEVGCGSGHWLPSLTDKSPGEALGLDRSLGMLSRARLKSVSRSLVQGDAAALPFASAPVGLTVCVNALHHFHAPRRFLQETERVTGAGGLVLIVGLDAHDPKAEWYIYDHFDSVQARDEQRYPPWDDVRQWVESAGMTVQEVGLAHAIREELLGEQVFKDPFLARGGTSQLALLSDEDYTDGLDRIRREVAHGGADGGPARFRTHLDLRYLLARVEDESP